MTPITILGVHTPKWASNAPLNSKEYHLYPPKNSYLNDYSNYVKTLVREYGPSIYAYEVWNEPNTSVFYRGTPEQFSGLLNTSYKSVKELNPEANVVAFGLTHYDQKASDFMLKTLQKSGTNKMDAV